MQHSHETPTYTNWGPNQPDSADQHCVFLWGIHQGQWADYLCEASVEMKDFHLLDFFQEHQSSGGRDIHVLCEAEANGTPPLKVVSASKEQSHLNQVLWLGNSYTFYNDLPVMVARLAAAQGKSILYSNHTEVIFMYQHSKTLLFLEQLELEDARRVAADNGADSEPSLGCCCPARAKSQACLSCSNRLRGFHKAPCLTCCLHQGQQP